MEKIFRVSDVQRKALRLCQETTLVGNSTSKRVERLYAHDAYGNVTDTYEYDFGNGPVFQVATTSTPAACARPPSGTYARRTLKTYKTGDYVTDANHLFGLTDTEIVYNAGDNATAQTTYEYDQRPLLDKEAVDHAARLRGAGGGPRDDVRVDAGGVAMPDVDGRSPVSGFCVQFASCAMWMPRLSGIPADMTPVERSLRIAFGE